LTNLVVAYLGQWLGFPKVLVGCYSRFGSGECSGLESLTLQCGGKVLGCEAFTEREEIVLASLSQFFEMDYSFGGSFQIKIQIIDSIAELLYTASGRNVSAGFGVKGL
jgi:hypothetical protein